MNAPANITLPLEKLARAIRGLNDHEKLMLMDWIGDRLDDDDANDDLHGGFSKAFNRVEESIPCAAEYPETGNTDRWAKWRAERDAILNNYLGKLL